VTDPITGLSKGYGFVRFGDESEQQRSMVEMQGLFLGSRPIRVAAASAKGKLMAQQVQSSASAISSMIPTPTPSVPAAAVPPPPVIQRMKYPNEPVSVQEANQLYLQVQSYMMEHGNILVSDH
jgi:RNA recognition motif-containing protein